MKINKFGLSIICAGIVSLTAVPQLSRAQNGEVPIFKGELLSEIGLSVAPWGSGEVKAVTEYSFLGNQSIKVTTHGRYQGARFIVAKPMDLKSATDDGSAYLQFVYLTPDKNGAGRMAGEGSMQGRGPGGPTAGTGGKGGPTLGGSGGSQGSGGSNTSTNFVKPKPLSALRVVVLTTDGKSSEAYIPIDSARTEREDWQSIAIPVGQISGMKDSCGIVKEIRLFGDSPTLMYVGQIRILKDETPIHVDDVSDQTVSKNETVTFSGGSESGPTPVKYEWTIQGVKSKDGDPQEVTTAYVVVGEGRTFKHKFVKGGDYQITLTVSDVYGIKKSATTKASVHVTL